MLYIEFFTIVILSFAIKFLYSRLSRDVTHSQRMNDPLVEIWIIAGSDGSIFSAHCVGCKAGLAESCSHVASILFYIECWTRINGKLACTQVKCTWLLPAYVSQVSYAKAKDIDFTSAKKLKENLDKKIESLDECAQDQSSTSSSSNTQVTQVRVSTPVSADEMAKVYEKLNQCETKAVALSLIDPYAEQFISKSRNFAFPSDLYETNNLEYPDLLRKCLDVQLNISNEDIQLVEKDTRSQAKASSFFRHRAGRIGASVCGAVYHTNLAQPSQSLIQSMCYPHLFKLNTKAIQHGIKYEDYAIKAYEQCMRSTHVNFKLEICGMFINKVYQFIHATPDFLVSCDCCGLGIGEVKCPISIPNGDFGKYLLKKNCCLEKVNGEMKLKREHNYYYQV